jgi:hypothetical protein
MMLAHYVVRRVMHDAADTSRLDSDRLSFRDSLRISQSQLPEAPRLSIETRYDCLFREVRLQRLRPRRERWYARVIKLKMSNWDKNDSNIAVCPRRPNPFANP